MKWLTRLAERRDGRTYRRIYGRNDARAAEAMRLAIQAARDHHVSVIVAAAREAAETQPGENA